MADFWGDDVSSLECLPRRGLRLDPVNDRLSGVSACGHSISVPPQLVAMRGAISVGGIAGDWQTVQMMFAEAGETLPAGAKVLGANGALYKLVGDANADPTTDDGTNWVLMAPPAVALDQAAKSGAPLGDWAKVKAAYVQQGKTIPLGAYVMGSDGVTYKLVGNPDVDPTTDDGSNWKVVTPKAACIACAADLGGVAGDWKKVKDALAASGKTMPPGTIVIGSDGAMYQLKGDPDVDPVTDAAGVHWTNLTLQMYSFIELTF